MIFNKEAGLQQVAELCHFYEGLQLVTETTDQLVLSGTIEVNRVSKEFVVCKEYKISVIIPLYSDDLPYVIDLEHSIDENYMHRYQNGRLCLETDTNIRIRFCEGFSLSVWMSEFVEPYFFSYEYYQRYGEFPFGEWSHGIKGIFETYETLFNESDDIKVLRLMASIASQRYRGHMMCPCQSGMKLRLCHGLSVAKYYTNNQLRKIVCADYEMIKETFEQAYEQQCNSE